jgi:hypothetical protein
MAVGIYNPTAIAATYIRYFPSQREVDFAVLHVIVGLLDSRLQAQSRLTTSVGSAACRREASYREQLQFPSTK